MTGEAPASATRGPRFLRLRRLTAHERIGSSGRKRQEPKRHEPQGRLQEKRRWERNQRELAPDPRSADPARRAAEQTVEAGRNGKGGRRRGRWHFSGRRRASSRDDSHRDRTLSVDTDGGASLKPQERKPDDRRRRRAISLPRGPARPRRHSPPLQGWDLRRRRNAAYCAESTKHGSRPLTTVRLVKPITSRATTARASKPSIRRRTNATGGRCTGPQHPAPRANL